MATRQPATTLSYSVRRDEPTRLEGFSDAVFGFSLALLAFSLEVPRSIEELTALTIAQLVPTLAAFSLMCWIWAEHNAFFRQFGLQNATTIVLNCALLFLVVFYTYPLKFMAVFLWGLIANGLGWTGIVSALESSGSLTLQGSNRDDAMPLMLIYSIGFIALFSILALLYGHALRQKDRLGLDDLELFEARHGLRVHLTSVTIGLLSLAALGVLWLVDPRWIGSSGMIYALMGPAHAINGVRYSRARETLIAARQAATVEDPDTPEHGA